MSGMMYAILGLLVLLTWEPRTQISLYLNLGVVSLARVEMVEFDPNIRGDGAARVGVIDIPDWS
jgi:hypothetical protein